MSLWQTLADRKVLLLSVVYFLLVIGGYGLDMFMPKILALAFPKVTVSTLGFIAAIPPLCTVPVMVLWGRHSDKTRERNWHVALASWCAAAGLALGSFNVAPVIAVVALALAVAGRWSAIPPFWGLPTAFLSGTSAAGGIAMINSIGNLGGFVGPYVMGTLKDLTGDYSLGLRLLAAAFVFGGLLALRVQPKAPAEEPPGNWCRDQSVARGSRRIPRTARRGASTRNAAAPATTRFETMTGGCQVSSPYASHANAPATCTTSSRDGRTKYDPTKTAVATHPTHSDNGRPASESSPVRPRTPEDRSVSRSVRTLSHSWIRNPRRSKKVRMWAASQPTISSSTGTSTLSASSLSTVRRAICAMNFVSDTAMVSPSRRFTCSITCTSELPSPM